MADIGDPVRIIEVEPEPVAVPAPEVPIKTPVKT